MAATQLIRKLEIAAIEAVNKISYSEKNKQDFSTSRYFREGAIKSRLYTYLCRQG